jgi:ABC-type transport system involved in Fe-S cluster assembly fused permease/ATPase subunit
MDHAFQSKTEKGDHSSEADKLVVIRLLSVMGGSLAISNQNLQGIAERYLRNKIGLSGKEIDLVKEKLANFF